VVIDKAVTVESVNGPAASVIEGYQVPGTTNGSSAVRCVYMTNAAALIGFTLTNGATLFDQGISTNSLFESCGGGAWCESTNTVISNCVICANTADLSYDVGGGAVSGTLENCVLAGNAAAAGGGAYNSILDNCTLSNNRATETGGGGAFKSTLYNCVLAGNSAPGGGGALDCTVNTCILSNNVCTSYGGGADGSVLDDCVIISNSAGNGGGSAFSILSDCHLAQNTASEDGGGSYSDTLNACTLSGDSASDLGGGAYSSSLTNCQMMSNSASSGGGADLGTLYNCTLLDNVAAANGGGVNSATAYNSAMAGNFALDDGGGAAESTLASCTLTGNSAFSGGGAYSTVLTNCIVYYNNGVVGTNYDTKTSLSYCCTTPLPIDGTGNISEDPKLADSFHLGSGSTCIGAGDETGIIGVDIDGDPWENPPSIGCDEFYPNTATGQMSLAIDATFTNLAAGFLGNFAAQIDGHAAMSYWDFGDGTRITNQPYVSHTWIIPGTYPVSLWAFNGNNPGGVDVTITVQVANQPIQYVSLTNSNPVAPYLSWATAATNIQDAVDIAYGGGVILVSNGVYQTGGRVAIGTLTNRLAIVRPTTVESVNGPGVTVIHGYQVPGAINGQTALRGVYLGNDSELIGFTIEDGATIEGFDTQSLIDADGGGIYCQSTNAMVLDCIIASNSCGYAGAGIYSGTAIGCQIVNNTNQSTGSFGGGGGSAYSVLLNDTITGNFIGSDGFGGAGVFSGTLCNCVISSNGMGGVLSSILKNCAIENNSNIRYAGGADLSTLNNCLVCDNRGGQSAGGGAYDCTLNSCIISNNFSSSSGGGVFYDSNQTNPVGQQNIIIGNTALSPPALGGGVRLEINANLNNWTFISNSAAESGGGLYVSSSGTVLNNCVFQGNSSGANGGGVCGPSPNLVSISNCTFIGNIASGNGGAGYSAALTNCYIIGNKAANGGGVYGTVNSCVLNDNSATNDGGGLYYYYSGSPPYPGIPDCAFTNNFALNGGGVFAGFLSVSVSNSAFLANWATNNGGGIDAPGTLSYCIVSDNTAKDGGGVYDTALANCLLSGNSADYGGGAFYTSPPLSLAQGSTIAGNNAAVSGGGFYWTVSGQFGVTNCIIYDNSAPANSNYPPANFYGAQYCCTVPLPLTRGTSNSNITNNPSFMNGGGGDFHLSSTSPCVNSGNNADVNGATDLDGNPRIVGGSVDIGAYEYQTPVSKISFAWLNQYDLPVVAGIDNSDLDGTGMTIYQDWIAGLNPTNSASVLAMLTPADMNTATGIKITWKSVSGILYFLQRSTNLESQSPFSTIQFNVPGRPDTTSYLDTSATNNVPYFYRVGVVAP
jgi:predicted outer membrane repeat protein